MTAKFHSRKGSFASDRSDYRTLPVEGSGRRSSKFEAGLWLGLALGLFVGLTIGSLS